MRPSPLVLFRAGTTLSALAVAFGAFGAHALKDRLEPRDLAVFEKAVQYQFLHAIALAVLGLALLANRARRTDADGWNQPIERRVRLGAGMLLLGTVVFCTALYLVAFGTKAFGAVAPIGGTAFIVGWLILASTPFGRLSGDPSRDV